MNPKDLGKRLVNVFVTSAVPNVAVGVAVGVEAWKSAVMAGGVAVLNVGYNLLKAFKDDLKLTAQEIDEILKEVEEPAKKAAPAKKQATKKAAPAKKTSPAKKGTAK